MAVRTFGTNAEMPPSSPRWRRRTRMVRRARMLTVAVVAAIALSACASPDFTLVASGTDTSNKALVMFMPSTANVYLAAAANAARNEATNNGYTLTVIENNFDQVEQDQQVQQYLASGGNPAAFLWWPATSAAGVNSNRQLAQIAPVIQWNQAVVPSAEPFIKAYAGVSDTGIGKTAGEQALLARAAAVAAGLQLHSPGGNLIEFGFAAGYQASVERHDAFTAATAGAPFNLLHNEPAGFDAQAGFRAASQIIPKYLSDGIDFIYCESNDLCVGVLPALEQNGLTPGKDVYVIAGTFSGDKQPLRESAFYSTVLQSPVIEGQLVVRTALQYLRTGEVRPGTFEVPPDPTDPGLSDGPPYQATYMPNPAITPGTIDTLRIWGLDVNQLQP
jgi:ABC-type sugar transport system substrate-binding protein